MNTLKVFFVKWIYQKEQDPEELVRRTMDFLGSVRQTLVLILVFLPTVLTLGFTAGIVRYTLFRQIISRVPIEDMEWSSGFWIRL